jgi:hypothetical protein
MIRHSRTAFLSSFAVAISLLAVQVHAQEVYVDLPFAGVSIVKPEGFELAMRFDGVENQSARVSIMAVLVQGSVVDASKAFQAGATLSNGVKVESRVDQNIAGKTGYLVKANQDSPLAKFKKWILFFGDGASAHMITANLPLEADDALMTSVKEALLKTKPFVGDKPDPMSDLPYEVASSTLKPSRREQKALVFTKDGVVPIKDHNDPVLIVGMSFGKSAVNDAEKLIVARIKQDPVESNWKLTTNAAIEINGLKGREVVTEGKDTKGNVRYGYWAVLMSGDDYYLFKGACGLDKAQAHIDSYSAIMRSFKLKDAGK